MSAAGGPARPVLRPPAAPRLGARAERPAGDLLEQAEGGLAWRRFTVAQAVDQERDHVGILRFAELAERFGPQLGGRIGARDLLEDLDLRRILGELDGGEDVTPNLHRPVPEGLLERLERLRAAEPAQRLHG